jgi:hypothetical protein
MKYCCFILVFFCTKVFSQTNYISGVVLNADDSSKLASASVFINNSTKGTLADAEGKFILEGITENNFELIISYTGFTTISLRITPENSGQFHIVKMVPRKNIMEGISIVAPEIDGWKKWGKFFTESFIGQSDFAGQCTIENPEVIKFFNDKKNNRLTAFSNGNLIIHNKALGYIIKYQLEEFEYDFKRKIVAYMGYTAFQEMKTRSEKKRKQWYENRKEVYAGSTMQFMRSLYADSVTEHGFEVHEKIRIYNTDSLFEKIYLPGKTPKTVKTEEDNFIVSVPEIPSFKKRPDYIDLINMKLFSFKAGVTFDSSMKQKEFYFENYLQIIYKNAMVKKDYLLANGLSQYLKLHQFSDVVLNSEDRLIIEKDGSYYNPMNFMSSGYWGWYKLAEMLPNDY